MGVPLQKYLINIMLLLSWIGTRSAGALRNESTVFKESEAVAPGLADVRYNLYFCR